MLGRLMKYYLVWQAFKQLRRAVTGTSPTRVLGVSVSRVWSVGREGPSVRVRLTSIAAPCLPSFSTRCLHTLIRLRPAPNTVSSTSAPTTCSTCEISHMRLRL